MRILELEEVKKIEFDILKTFNCFCKKRKINYFLSNGTLLGAVKYKGFIPWDDDIDVFVPRKDYDRLIKEFEDTEQYKLFSIERVPQYKFPFTKLCDMTTRKEEKNINNGVALGLDIDIFPLDYMPDEIVQAKRQIQRTKKVMNKLNFAKLDYNPGKSFIRTIAKNVFIFFAHCIGSSIFIKRIICIVESGSESKESRYIGCAVWPIYGEREIIPAEVFSDMTEVEFEGRLFPAPAGYDIYLRSLYGDYKKDPPISEQKTHHSYKAYKLD